MSQSPGKSQFHSLLSLLELAQYSPDFALHGKYVGPGHTGASSLGKENFSTKPVDSLDAAARKHDWAYRHGSDAERIRSDFTLAYEALKSIDPRRPAAAVKSAIVAAGIGTKGLVGALASPNAVYTAKPPKPPPHESLVDSEKARGPLKAKHAAFRGGVAVGTPAPHGAAISSVPPKMPLVGVHVNPGPQPNGKPTKKERAAQSARDKKASKPKPIPSKGKSRPSGGNKGGGVSTTLTPTTMQNTDVIETFERVVSRTNDGLVYEQLLDMGSINGAGPVVTSTSTYQVNSVVQSWLLDKDLWVGWQMGEYFGQHEQCMWLDTGYKFLPSFDSTHPGTCALYSDSDATDTLPIGTVVTAPVSEGHKGYKEHTIWKGVFSGKIVCNKAWIWTDEQLVVRTLITPPPPAADIRTYAAGVLNFLNGTGVLSTSPVYGKLFLYAKIAFRRQQNSDLGNLLFQAKLWVGTGQAFAWAASSITQSPLAFILSQLQNVSTNGQYEVAYNPRYVNPSGVINLPVGSYRYYSSIGFNSITATSTAYNTGNLSNSCVYSQNLDPYLITSGDTPEFTIAPLNPGSAPASRACVQGDIRITSILPGFNYAYFQPVQSVTYSAGGTVTAAAVRLYRIPEFATQPLFMSFPLGASGGVVTLDSGLFDVTISDSCVPSAGKSRTVVVPRKYVEDTKDALFKSWLSDDEKFTSVHFFVLPHKNVQVMAVPDVVNDYACSPGSDHSPVLVAHSESVPQAQLSKSIPAYFAVVPPSPTVATSAVSGVTSLLSWKR